MRYAIFSDIHGNWQAWNAVLTDMYDSDVDVPVCLGDIVGYGPCPQKVLDGIREVTTNFVMGNHDAAAAGVLDPHIFNDKARAVIEWTTEQLDDGAMEFLREMPMAIEDGNLMFIHAEIEEPGRFLYIDSEEEAEDNFQYNSHHITFVGHTHDPTVFSKDAKGTVTRHEDEDCVLDKGQRYIVNVGSVGEPRNPEDIRARYVIYDSETNELIFRRIEFDVEAYRADLQTSGLNITPYFLTVVDSYREAVAMSQQAKLMRDMRTQVHAPTQLQSRVRTIQSPTTGRPPLRRAPVDPPKASTASKLVLIISLTLLAISLTILGIILFGGDSRPDWAKKGAEAFGLEVDTPSIGEDTSPLTGGDNSMAGMIKTETGVDTSLVSEPTPLSTLAYWRIDTGNTALQNPSMANSVVGKTAPAVVAKVPRTGAANKAAAFGAAWKETESTGLFSLQRDYSFTFESFFSLQRPERINFIAGDRTDDTKDDLGWQVTAESGDRINLAYDPGKGTNFTTSVFIPDLFNGENHHLAIIWNHVDDSGHGKLTLYVDGEAEAELMIPHLSIPTEDTGKKFAIGARITSPKQFHFTGILDEIRFSSGVLPSSLFLASDGNGKIVLGKPLAIAPKPAPAAVAKGGTPKAPAKGEAPKSVGDSKGTPKKGSPETPPKTNPPATVAKSASPPEFRKDLIFYAPFEETKGEKVVLDLSGNGRNFLAGKTNIGQLGKVGSAIHFQKDGISSVAIPFGETKAFTAAFWILLDAEQITGEGPSNIVHIPGFATIQHDNNQLGINISGYDAPTVHKFEPDKKWHHILVENDGKNTTLFQDGTRVFTVPRDTAARKQPATAHIQIGLGASRYILDEVAMWQRILTPAEKTALVSLGNKGKSIFSMPEVVAHWSFDEKEGQIFNDHKSKFPLGSVGKPVSKDPIAPSLVPLDLSPNRGAAKVETLIQPPNADPDTFAITKNSGFTYEGWFLPASQKIANLGRTNVKTEGAVGWRFALAPAKSGKTGTVLFRYEVGEEPPSAMAADLEVYDGKPHHFAAIWTPKTKVEGVGSMTVFVDGKKVASADVPLSDIVTGKSDPLQIGGPDNSFLIDELRFTRGALSPKFFLRNYSVPPPAKPAAAPKPKPKPKP